MGNNELLDLKKVLTNISNYDLWDFYDYKLTEKEANTAIKALEEAVASREVEK